MKAVATKKTKLRLISLTVDPALADKYESKVLFPEKVAKAKAFLEKNGLPEGWGTFKPSQEK
ncbi:hypothetical protein [Spirosoma linguale]|uniref:Uncharacterized protein n=1 Tax=Spirosoma linguale (strain ATCC 33905 / DSM 74 / LMG 10896 / Claus 1) TaxID=504472 RepID=D2QU38_SPILD|nr:hypothetical protein Slin_6361 [Spirosoma linguale DSM 74]